MGFNKITVRWFPSADLLEFIEIRARAEGLTSGSWVNKHFGKTSSFRRQFDRMRANPDGTLKAHTADTYACLLGVHPSAIWPQWYAGAVPEHSH